MKAVPNFATYPTHRAKQKTGLSCKVIPFVPDRARERGLGTCSVCQASQAIFLTSLACAQAFLRGYCKPAKPSEMVALTRLVLLVVVCFLVGSALGRVLPSGWGPLHLLKPRVCDIFLLTHRITCCCRPVATLLELNVCWVSARLLTSHTSRTAFNQSSDNHLTTLARTACLLLTLQKKMAACPCSAKQHVLAAGETTGVTGFGGTVSHRQLLQASEPFMPFETILKLRIRCPDCFRKVTSSGAHRHTMH